VMTEGTAFVECEVLDRSQQADELLLMGLRIREGVDVDRLAAVSGLVPSQAAIAELVEAGLITSDGGGRRLRATPAGRFILNRLVLELAASFEPP
ncbi:MAG: radical SAM family heme chaperone HemW, partial [Hyphomicrobiaceae bacterium]